MVRRALPGLLIWLALISAVAVPLTASSAHSSARTVAFDWARAQAGKPYIWGGTGPGGFDCSGLVYAAYLRAGVRLPRDTFGMLAAVASGLLQPTSRPEQGDLAFYGSGHVELVTARPSRSTFGALEPGTVVGWHRFSGWWHPTMYFHIRGAG